MLRTITRTRLPWGALAIAALVAMPRHVAAQERSAKPDTTGPRIDTLTAVVTTSYRFLDKDVSGVTGLPLPVEKVPQSISLVNNDFVKAADLQNMGEIAQYTPGALWASFSPSYGNQFWLRGFSSGFAADGLTVGDQVADPDPSILDRYEIVKGPASVVYGAQSPGGIVNLVSKSAAHAPTYLELLAGSWGRWRIEGQTAKSLNRSGTIRGIGVVSHEEGGSFVNFVDRKKSVAYGGVDFLELPHGVSGYARVAYQRGENTPFNGLPTFADGTLVPVSRSFFLGGSKLNNISQATRADAGMTWRPADLWSFDLKAIYQYTTHDGQNAYPYTYIGDDGSFTFGGENFDDWHVDDYQVGASATRKLDDLGLAESSVSVSVRYQHYRYYIFERSLTGGTANVFAGDAAVSDSFNLATPGTTNYQQDQRMNYLTASSQAVVKVASPVTLVGGIAYSRPNVDQQVYSGPFQNYDPGDQVNYRGGLIVDAARGLTLYASYGESYQPNLRIDVDHDVLAPVAGRQYEVGAKYDLNGSLLLTAALFDIDESNVAVYDTTVANEALYRAKDVRHRGLELEASGRLTTHWQVKGGVALLDPKVTNDPQNPVNNGETRPWLPRTSASAYTSYTFGQGASIGGGVRYVGAVKTYDNSSASRTPDISSYTVVDGVVGYPLKRFLLQLNVKNIFDEHYYMATPVFQSLRSGLYPGEPRSAALSVRTFF